LDSQVLSPLQFQNREWSWKAFNWEIIIIKKKITYLSLEVHLTSTKQSCEGKTADIHYERDDDGLGFNIVKL
jgi:hypothetical protein